MAMDYVYKSTGKCKTCVWLRHKHLVKQAQVMEMRKFNPQGSLTMADFHKKYQIPVHVINFMNHCNSHIVEAPKVIVKTIINEKAPIKSVMDDLTLSGRTQHETALDEYIAQFEQKVRDRQLPITVKDGLAAIKIKADMVKGDKDRKKDILKIMVGANEQRRP